MIRSNVIQALQQVIDPETGADVYRMRLVINLHVDKEGIVTYLFRPSSPLCSIALTLVIKITEKIKTVEGVKGQKIKVIDYIGAEELNKILSTLPTISTNV